ncbi:DUF4843 domain-containing protein [Pseudoflavitalea sp. G-6-1-2]|uniref:DUF4843 domain-containing protein n=1 Tax=Pseudoflavitalea sp. G-6-1-2 TaxID=2728841 RepID=UPI00146CCEE6|nr:DUF4843 domain-containing protein [Pseudoflavitalea sp. G-6-1-2]NML21870.1 DUF4843 domain-containing protein [Pseudoflavitalea sp. G-6-1-2]
MKQLAIILLGFTGLFVQSCSKRDIPTYKGDHYIQFTTAFTDTTQFSFFFHPGKTAVDLAMPVKLTGTMPQKDLNYMIEVVQDKTNAPSTTYTLPTVFRYRAGFTQDTAHIVFRNIPQLATEAVLLTIRIKDTEEVKAGQTNYAYRVFRISDLIAKPGWWNADMDRFYLGIYSEKKFRAFMDVTGVGDLDAYDPNEQRVLMLRFKYHLIEMKENGTPLLLEDGSDMLASLPLIG